MRNPERHVRNSSLVVLACFLFVALFLISTQAQTLNTQSDVQHARRLAQEYWSKYLVRCGDSDWVQVERTFNDQCVLIV